MKKKLDPTLFESGEFFLYFGPSNGLFLMSYIRVLPVMWNEKKKRKMSHLNFPTAYFFWSFLDLLLFLSF